MMRTRKHFMFGALVIAVALAVPLLAATLDDGRLEVSWFADDAKFREVDEIDYFWVTEGFDIVGHTLHFVKWPEPSFVGPKAKDRDVNDIRLAKSMAATMAEAFSDSFAKAYGDKLKTSLEDGDIRVEGRIVDCSTGSTAAKMIVGFGAGAGNTTIDLRFIDVATGKTFAGLHHRCVSGTNWSSTDSKFYKWIEKATNVMSKWGMARLYDKGKLAKK